MKILHLIEKGAGLQQAPQGFLESLPWALDDEDRQADFVACHKQKSQRSWKGGRMLGVRNATDAEIQECKGGKGVKQAALVVQFEPLREYNGRPGVPWGRSDPVTRTMASKSLEVVPDQAGSKLA